MAENINKNFLDDDWWETATTDDVKAEIAKGADVNASDDKGITVLMYASKNTNDVFTVLMLLKNGADINARDKDEMTPLMYAAQNYKNQEIIELFIKKGVNLDLRDCDDYTALTHAAENCNHEIVDILIEAGANTLGSIKGDSQYTGIGGIIEYAVENNMDIDYLEKVFNI